MSTSFSEFLTPKQQLFCDEYLMDMNATRAALTAGYSAATALNGQLMRLPKIKLYLQQRVDDVSARLAITHDKLLQELSKVAFGNMANYVDAEGKIKPLNEIGADDMAAVQSLTIAPDGTVNIKLCNKMAALERIAKHLNFYKAHEKQREWTHVYLNKAHITEDDTFDDERLKEEIRNEKKQEAKRLKREAEREEAKIRKQKVEVEAGVENQESGEASAIGIQESITKNEEIKEFAVADVAVKAQVTAPVMDVPRKRVPTEAEKAWMELHPIKPVPFLKGREVWGNTFTFRV